MLEISKMIYKQIMVFDITFLPSLQASKKFEIVCKHSHLEKLAYLFLNNGIYKYSKKPRPILIPQHVDLVQTFPPEVLKKPVN